MIWTLTIEVSEMVQASRSKIFSNLNTPQKCLRFEREIETIKVSGDEVRVLIKLWGMKRTGVFKFKTAARTRVELELTEGDMEVSKIWYRLLPVDKERTRVIHGVQFNTNSKVREKLLKFLARKIRSHERTEVLSLKRAVEKGP